MPFFFQFSSSLQPRSYSRWHCCSKLIPIYQIPPNSEIRRATFPVYFFGNVAEWYAIAVSCLCCFSNIAFNLCCASLRERHVRLVFSASVQKATLRALAETRRSTPTCLCRETYSPRSVMPDGPNGIVNRAGRFRGGERVNGYCVA
jgi:hypothetical protein